MNGIKIYFYCSGADACCRNAFNMIAVPREGEGVNLDGELCIVEMVIWQYRTGETAVDVHLRRVA